MRIRFITFRRLVRQLFGLSTKWEDVPISTRDGHDLDMFEEVPYAEVVLPVYPKRWISKEEFQTLVAPYLSKELT